MKDTDMSAAHIPTAFQGVRFSFRKHQSQKYLLVSFKSSLPFVSGSADPQFFRLAPKRAVQGRYNENLVLSVLSRSLQGIAERPLPCNYNVIQPDIALSRRKRGFKSRRGRQINNLRGEFLLSI